MLSKAVKILLQKKEDKKKILVWHAHEVECIAKGNVKKLYDGHTLDQIERSVEGITGVGLDKIYVDRGYKGHNFEDKLKVYKSGQKKDVVGMIKKELKRRSAIESIIGHAKMSHKLDKCCLKGEKGDRINAIFAAIGFNMKQLLNWFREIFCKFFYQFNFSNFRLKFL